MSEEVALPEKFKRELGLPHGMDYHLVDITLKDGRKFCSIPVRHGAVIAGIRTDGTKVHLDFASDDILHLSRAHFASVKRLLALVVALVLAGLIALLLR